MVATAPLSNDVPKRGRMLLASIHDVSPRSESQVDRLVDLFDRELGTARYAMLVVPDHWGEAPLRAAPAFQARLRRWAEAGIEMFVHGWYHQDRSEHTGLTALKARHMTASEGEFLGLDQAEATRRIADGKALVEDVIGRPAAGFIAPAWLYGPGARAALRTSGLALAEDHWRVWDAASEAQLARGPVVTWASRSTARTASSIAFAALARRFLPALPVVRVASHPGDVTKPALIASIETTLRHFSATHSPSRYADLRR